MQGAEGEERGKSGAETPAAGLRDEGDIVHEVHVALAEHPVHLTHRAPSADVAGLHGLEASVVCVVLDGGVEDLEALRDLAERLGRGAGGFGGEGGQTGDQQADPDRVRGRGHPQKVSLSSGSDSRKPAARLAGTMFYRLLLLFALLAPVPVHAESFERDRSQHFLLLHDLDFERRTGRQGSGHFERGVLESLEGSYRRLDTLLGIAPRRRIDVIVHDRERFDRDFAGRFRFPSAGFFADRIHIRGSSALDAGLESVLAHELVHAALFQQAPSLRLPAWMNEGIAMWFEARRIGKTRLSQAEQGHLVAAAREGRWLGLGALSTPSFSHFGSAQARLAYLQAYALVDHLGSRRGERVLRDWVRRSLRSGDPQRSLERASGLSLEALEASLRRSLGI